MSHPDPLYDYDNSYEDDVNYDDYNDFHDDNAGDFDMSYYNDHGYEEDEDRDDSTDDSMDGDFDSAMRDAGFGTDEDYGYYGEDY